MKKLFYFGILAGLSLAMDSNAADVKGKVSFDGKAKPGKPIKMNADPYCSKANSGKKVLSEKVVVNSNGTLKNVVVYIKDAKGKTDGAKPLEFDQTNCVYVPHVVALQTGQTLKIVNSDATLHNVHALPKKNKTFNVGMARKGQTIEKTFTKPEMGIRVKCDVHGWMNSYVSVFNHPYFAVTGDDGSFTISGLEPGEYTVEAWHEKFKTTSKKIKVEASGATVDLSYGKKG